MLTIEYAIWKVIIRNKPVNFLGLYHLPVNAKDKTINNMFIDNISEKYPNWTSINHGRL